jgi:HD-GYP domain-containing protein (c-di-GMP phosphodiesterase class II)
VTTRPVTAKHRAPVHTPGGAWSTSLRAYVTAVAAVGLASLALPPAWSAPPLQWIPALAVLTLISIVLEFQTVPLPAGGSFSMATAPHVATILLVPPPIAAASIGLSILVEELVRGVPRQKVAFNVGAMVVNASIGSLAVGLLGGLGSAGSGSRGDFALVSTLVVVAIAYFVVNAVLLSVIFSILERRSIRSVLWQDTGSTMLGELAMTAIGAQYAVMWSLRPVLVILLAIPAVVIARSFVHIRRLNTETRSAVRSLAEIVDHRDATTFHHSERVAVNAVRLARFLELRQADIEMIEQAATVHDLGKIGVPDRVLLKPGPLTPEEWEIMRLHTDLGSEIVSRFELFRPGAEIVRHHHERWDGTGYPDRLAGAAIPLGARVVAVADAFDAMTSDRPYRGALSEADALGRIAAGAGTYWDPAIVEAFLALLRDAEPLPIAGVPLRFGDRPVAAPRARRRPGATDLEQAKP